MTDALKSGLSVQLINHEVLVLERTPNENKTYKNGKLFDLQLRIRQIAGHLPFQVSIPLVVIIVPPPSLHKILVDVGEPFRLEDPVAVHLLA